MFLTYLILNQHFLPGYKEKRKLLVPAEQFARPKANQIAPHDLASEESTHAIFFGRIAGSGDENGGE